MDRRKSRTALFLMEIIMVILFFSLTAAVYVQIFVKAHMLSGESERLTEATLRAQNMAEAFYACDADTDEIMELFPLAELEREEGELPDDTDAVISLYYGSDWSALPPSRADVASFVASMSLHAGSEMAEGSVTVAGDDEEEIYRLELKKYIPGNGD